MASRGNCASSDRVADRVIVCELAREDLVNRQVQTDVDRQSNGLDLVATFAQRLLELGVIGADRGRAHFQILQVLHPRSDSLERRGPHDELRRFSALSEIGAISQRASLSLQPATGATPRDFVEAEHHHRQR